VSVVETILVFVVAPAAVVGVMALLIWGGPGGTRAPRYRPGREWAYEPVWYAPHPLAVQDLSHDDDHVRRPELSTGSSRTTAASPGTPPTAAGGARGMW